MKAKPSWNEGSLLFMHCNQATFSVLYPPGGPVVSPSRFFPLNRMTYFSFLNHSLGSSSIISCLQWSYSEFIWITRPYLQLVLKNLARPLIES